VNVYMVNERIITYANDYQLALETDHILADNNKK